MRYNIHQIPITNEDSDTINTLGVDALPKFCVYIKLSIDTEFKPEYSRYFEKVATTEAEDLEEVFRIFNIYDLQLKKATSFVRHRSLSVGDIIESVDTEEFFIVRQFGFETINFIRNA